MDAMYALVQGMHGVSERRCFFPLSAARPRIFFPSTFVVVAPPWKDSDPRKKKDPAVTGDRWRQQQQRETR